MAFTYISPYVRKYWSKRLWYNRPTSIRCKLRSLRWHPSKKRLPQCAIRDMNTIRPYRHLERINYALRHTEPKNILKPKYAHL